MAVADFIQEFGLKPERLEGAELDNGRVTLSEGKLTLNRVVIEGIKINKYPYAELFAGNQSTTLMLAFNFSSDPVNNAIKVETKTKKIGKGTTKTATIDVKRVLLKYGVDISKTFNVDIIECLSGTLVLAVLGAVEKKETQPEKEKTESPRDARRQGPTNPFGPITVGNSEMAVEVIGGVENKRLEGSDF